MVKHNRAVINVGVLLLIIFVVLGYFLRLDAYLPHDRIEIILPFEKQYDASTVIIPMGETIHHPKSESPKGHPGIDFGSQEAYPYIAVTDGKISKIQYVENSGNDITLNKGVYNIVYKEMDPKNTFVKEGQNVKQGDKIALSYPKIDAGNKHYSTHWEFASVSVLRDRFCPLTYFTQESRERIEDIWEKTKSTSRDDLTIKFPHICSGDYFNRVE